MTTYATPTLFVALAVAIAFEGAVAQPGNVVAHGIQPALVYDGAAFGDLAGGALRGATYLGTLRVQLTSMGYAWPAFPA